MRLPRRCYGSHGSATATSLELREKTLRPQDRLRLGPEHRHRTSAPQTADHQQITSSSTMSWGAVLVRGQREDACCSCGVVLPLTSRSEHTDTGLSVARLSVLGGCAVVWIFSMDNPHATMNKHNLWGIEGLNMGMLPIRSLGLTSSSYF